MDSNERKIVQELVTVLGCVIPASDGYEPRTNLWNKYTAAKNMLSAAPQVVAEGWELPVATWFAIDHADGVQFHPSEEQALRYSESGQCVKYFSEDQMRAALQAAPVQAQEPVAEVSAMPGTSGFTMAVFKADDMPIGSKVFRAPVQPVAVPQVELLLAALNNIAEACNCCGDRSDLAVMAQEALDEYADAAPAAQGDAWLEKCEALIDIWDDGNKPEDERAYFSGAFPEMLEEIRAAIAAKAES